MAKGRVLEWDPEGDQPLQIRFHRRLLVGVELTSDTLEVELHEKVAGASTDISAKVTKTGGRERRR